MPSTPRVLLVEDDPEQVVLTRTRFAVSRGSWEMESADTLAGALARLGQGGIDAVLLDLVLPDSRGLETVERLCAEFPELPVVVLTSYGDEAVGVQALKKGAQDYLIKTHVDNSALERSLRYAIERGRAEQAVARWAAIVQSSEDAIVGLTPAGVVSSWNEGAARMFGWTPEQAVGRSLEALAAEGSAGPLAALIGRVRGGERVPPQECVWVRRDGRRVPVSVILSPIHTASGREVGLSLVARDITDSRAMQEALRESEARFRAIFETSPLGLSVIDSELRFVRVNPAYASMVGRTVEELSSLRLPDVTHPEDVPADLAALERLHGGQVALYRMEKRYLLPQGEALWGAVTASVLRDDQGRPAYTFAVVENITERRKSAEERERLIGELQSALARIKTLRGLLPICSSCKKVRDDQGYWKEIEVYLRNHSEAELTHGLCPGCAERLYPDYFKKTHSAE